MPVNLLFRYLATSASVASKSRTQLNHLVGKVKNHKWKWADASMIALPVEVGVMAHSYWSSTLSSDERKLIGSFGDVLRTYSGPSASIALDSGTPGLDPLVHAIASGPGLKGLASAVNRRGVNFTASRYYKLMNKDSETIHVIGSKGMELFRFSRKDGYQFPIGLSSSVAATIRSLTAVKGSEEFYDAFQQADFSKSILHGWLSYLDMVASLLFPARGVMQATSPDDVTIISDPESHMRTMKRRGMSYDDALSALKIKQRTFLGDDIIDPFFNIVDELSDAPAIASNIKDANFADNLINGSKEDNSRTFLEGTVEFFGEDVPDAILDGSHLLIDSIQDFFSSDAEVAERERVDAKKRREAQEAHLKRQRQVRRADEQKASSGAFNVSAADLNP